MAQSPTTVERRRQLREKIGDRLEKAIAGEPIGLDGMKRTPEDEAALNQTFALLFRGARGKEVLEYLESLTIHRVAGPGVDPNTVLHMEGSRFVVGIIKQRIQLGRNQ